jgi:hypothetical protein
MPKAPEVEDLLISYASTMVEDRLIFGNTLVEVRKDHPLEASRGVRMCSCRLKLPSETSLLAQDTPW